MVYYRTYRPQKIAELDSPKLRETLTAVLSQKEIPHAFLFTGPKGLGKTSTARIIAKIVNCEHADKGKGMEPCNICDQCVSITNGNNMDVLEIDGASNRGIDEIRELRERVNLAPVRAKKKVYIIDEVHMLTTEAFNALLKTIEEPPSHVLFIFATTEPQKVPATIISRCFHISLQKATTDEIVHALKRIVDTEKIQIDDDALILIAEMGDGGYRDATKVFEEVVALSDGAKITKELVEEKTNVSRGTYYVSHIMESLFKKDIKAALEVLQEVNKQGMSIKYFIEQILLQLQKILLDKAMGQASLSQFAFSELQILINVFSQAYQDTKYAVVPSLPLELAVVMYCQDAQNNSSAFTMKDAIKKEQNLKVQQIISGKNDKPDKKIATSSQTDLPKDAQDTAVFLENIIYKVKPHNISIAGVLRSCIVQSVSDEEVVFTTSYTFHKERLEDAKARELLEQVIKEITGKKVRVKIELAERR